MFKMITNRGSGRTYNMCEYAIKYKCNIITPMLTNAKYALKCIDQICEDSNVFLYKDCKIAPDYVVVTIYDNSANSDFDIYIYSAKYVQNHQYDISSSKKPFIVDDIDRCFRKILGINDFQGFTLGFDEFSCDT